MLKIERRIGSFLGGGAPPVTTLTTTTTTTLTTTLTATTTTTTTTPVNVKVFATYTLAPPETIDFLSRTFPIKRLLDTRKDM